MNRISWFEIAADDLDRAQEFYEKVFQVELKREGMGEMGEMAIFPHGDNEVSGCITAGPMYKPSATGSIVYLYVQEDLAETLKRVAQAGGKTLMEPTDLGDIGFIALFGDSEGNTVGLHTSK